MGDCHFVMEKALFNCSLCPLTYSKKSNLDRHMNSYHMKTNESITFFKQNFISRSRTTDDSFDMEVDSNENIEHPEMYKEQNFDDTTDMEIDKNENIVNPESNEEQNTFEQLMDVQRYLVVAIIP